MAKSKVYLVAHIDRKEGAKRCLAHLGPLDYTGKRVYVKPNFNTADPTPGSTHNDTLEQLLAAVSSAGAASVTLGERSGPAVTAEVLREKGIPELCAKYGVNIVNFEELGADDWATITRPDLHWPDGVRIPSVAAGADVIAATCCLKTHGFGGVYSNSLKLAVGLTPKDFSTLHHSPDIRKMIAEINLAYTPDFVLVDAVEVFTDGGPMKGTLTNADMMFIGSDRVALDAVGLAILKSLGSNSAIMDTPIFKQEQIARAVELGLGVTGPEEIEIVTDDDESAAYAAKLNDILATASF